MRKVNSRFGIKNVLLLAGLFLNISLFSQIKDPETYIRKYIKDGDTNHLSSALNQINGEFIRYNNKELRRLLIRAAEKGESGNYPNLAVIYSLIRQHYINEGNRPKTLEYSLKQYKTLSRTGNADELLWILIDIGNMFYDESEYDQALNFYIKAETIGQRQKVSSQLSVVYLNFGLVYLEKKDFNAALKYFHKSIHYRIQEKNVQMAASTFVQIAGAHIDLAEADSAYKYILLAEDYYYTKKVDNENKLTEIPMYIEMAWFDYYALMKDHSKAITHFSKAQENARKFNLMYDFYSNIFFEAKYYSDLKEYETAISKLKSTLPFFWKNRLQNEERYVYKMLGSLYSKLNKTDETSKYLSKYVLLDDSIRKSSMKSQLDVMRTIAAVYESDASLERTKKNLQIEKINTQLRVKERNTSIWIAVLAIFGALILLGLFFNLKRNRKTLLSLHKQLKNQHMEMKINSLELERTNKIKDKLFSIIAHDLRNPLNRLMAELSIAKKRSSDHLLDPMEVTLKETINLFESLLQWSKLDNNQNIYSPTKVNLGENINKIISFYLPEIQSKNITIINNSTAITALADRNILQTLLRNILSNAIASIAREGREGTIEIETKMSGKEVVSIGFHDSGSGFPDEILEGFSNSENITNGKGLGLSICKMLAKMSGWTMEISNDSKLNGAKIVLLLPVFMDESASREVKITPLSAAWKTKLEPLQNFKFYQNSEIRRFLKSLGQIQERSVQMWIGQLEEAVLEGNELDFVRLLKMLDEDSGVS